MGQIEGEGRASTDIKMFNEKTHRGVTVSGIVNGVKSDKYITNELSHEVSRPKAKRRGKAKTIWPMIRIG